MLLSVIAGLMGLAVDAGPLVASQSAAAALDARPSISQASGSFDLPSLSWAPQGRSPFAPAFDRRSEAAVPPSAQPPSAPGPASQPNTTCAVRILRADPRVDPGMAWPVPRQVDAEMVRKSPCAK
jgi:hypothetical protein